MKGGQSVRHPSNGVGLARASAVLDEIVVAGAFGRRGGDEFPHAVELVVAWEDERLATVLLLQVDELLQDVHHRILLEDRVPDVVRDVSVLVLGIALASVHAGAVGALVEGQEVGRLLAVQTGDHPRLVEVHAEECKHTTVELEADLSGVPVGFPLELRVLGGLAGHLVLQFEGEHGYAVDGEDHVHGLVRLPLRVVPLSVDFDAVLRVKRCGGLVQR